MPKIKPDSKEEARRVARACISHNMERYGLKDEQVALKLHMATRSLRNRRDSPEKFTLEELWSAAQTLKLTPVQAASIVLGRNFTSKEIKEFILM